MTSNLRALRLNNGERRENKNNNWRLSERRTVEGHSGISRGRARRAIGTFNLAAERRAHKGGRAGTSVNGSPVFSDRR